MSDFTEFQAKSIDMAIQDACRHFNAERTKLEIEIIEDAKTGIFGLVGARKARVKARLVQLPDFATSNVEPESKKSSSKQRGERSSEKPAPKNERKASFNNEVEDFEPKKSVELEFKKSSDSEFKKNVNVESKKAPSEKKYPVKSPQVLYDEEEGESQCAFLSKMNTQYDDEELDDHVLEALDREAAARANILGNATEAEIRANSREYRYENEGRGKAKNTRGRQQKNGERKEYEKKAPQKRYEKAERPRFQKEGKAPQEKPVVQEPKVAKPAPEYDVPTMPRIPLVELDAEKLLSVSKDTIFQLVRGIVGEDAPIEASINDDRVCVRIESEDTGLLIGREGQHLAAIQYIAARIITNAMGAQVRIQVDTGDYHSRQDKRMQDLALSLAERVRMTGRPQSTRPISAYQRRVIHLALQEQTDIITRSSGEGALKRVIILKNRNNQARTEEGCAENEVQNTEVFVDDIQNIQIDADMMDVAEVQETDVVDGDIVEFEADENTGRKQTQKAE